MREPAPDYLALLQAELLPALGCTEPIAIAFAAARCRRLLGQMPEGMTVQCSGNIIKNVKSVVIPGSGGMRGIETAAILGAVAGDDTRGLEVLAAATPQHARRAAKLRETGLCAVDLLEGAETLHIVVHQQGGGHSALVEVAGGHQTVVREERDGAVLTDRARQAPSPTANGQQSPMTLDGILRFAEETPLPPLQAVLQDQLDYNLSIAGEGLSGSYGAQVGRVVMEGGPQNPRTLAIAHAAAGSDARMNGCAMPVVVNSGSGNQGMTVSLPVVVYARAVGAGQNAAYRALALSNLLALYQKSYIGKLSAYCGVVSAACGSVAGIAFLEGAGRAVIEGTVINMLGTISGMVCDGAKASCAAKIAAALQTGFLAYDMAKAGHVFQNGDGLTKNGADATIRAVGRMGREGMRGTDTEILRIMLEG